MRPATEPPKAAAGAEPPALPRRVLKEAPALDGPAAKPAAPRVGAAPSPEPLDSSAPAPTGAPAPSPSVGVVRFVSDVPGASVFIDRVFVGVTPVTADVKPGSHRLNLSLEGYEPVLETIEVAPGPSDFVFKYKEVRLDAKVDVVHKHRLGSCKGVLVATPHRLRYDTTDKNDAFTVALLDVESLEIDYLENRLRVSLREGKRYDFADPESNADRLFVFHRDVEKARERLKKGDQPAPE